MGDKQLGVKWTLDREGPYSKDPGDSGGETVWGIDYTNNKDYTPLWDRLHALRLLEDTRSLAQRVKEDLPILNLARDYYEKLWDRLCLTQIPHHGLAVSIFGAYHNQGPERSIKWLQFCLNALSDPGHPELREDGVMGGNTIARLHVLDMAGRLGWLINAFNAKRRVWYMEYGHGSGKWAVKGLLKRLDAEEALTC